MNACNIKLIAIASAFALTISCNSQSTTTSKQFFDVQNDVQLLMDSIAKNVSARGPIAWLQYFQNSSDFFMASNGALVFPNYDSAFNFTKNALPKIITTIELQWNNIRIEPLNDQNASVGASFHENITYTSGTESSTDGYFTAIASKTKQGWQLHTMHWSTKESQQ